jgi:hypothetical protein
MYAGEPESIHELVGFIQKYLSKNGVLEDFEANLEVKYSHSHGSDCFRHMRVKVKAEVRPDAPISGHFLAGVIRGDFDLNNPLFVHFYVFF